MIKKWFLVFSVIIGVVGGRIYSSVGRLSGMGVFHPDMGFREYGWIVDDPIFIGQNGSLIPRLTNEIGIEPFGAIYSGNWKDSFAYGILQNKWFFVGLLLNDNPEPDDYLKYYTSVVISSPPTFPGANSPDGYSLITLRDRKPWFDAVVGTKVLPFSPYLGFSVIAAAISTNVEYIPNPVDPTKSVHHGEEKAFLWKIRLGASIDILKPLVIDTSVGVWLPSFSIQRTTTMTEIPNYQNEEKHISEGNLGIEIRAYPQLHLSPQMLWKNMLMYRYLSLNSTHTVTIDLNGDRDFIDLGELKSRNTHPFSMQVIGVGTGVSYTNANFLTFVSINNFTILRTEEWFTVNQSTGSDVYTDKETGNEMMNYVILTPGAEVALQKWMSLRMGLGVFYFISTITKTSYTYTGTTETLKNSLNQFALKTMLVPQFGFSIHFRGFSFDWMISDTFVQTVIGRGFLPYLISGNNSFDNFSMIASLRYNF